MPEPYKKSFNGFTGTLHIDFFYNGSYPKDKVEEEFRKWFKKVEAYIDDLESKVRERDKRSGDGASETLNIESSSSSTRLKLSPR